ncbi:MAG: hypothetical protein FWH51_05940 [Dehalococcoidia bacterium]|nr:hypothetical protein [Dehalococcoidia bacterium]
MTIYNVTWRDFQLPTGQAFAMAVCGYSKLVRHMTIGLDPIRRMFVKGIEINEEHCNTNEHCLALECHLNHTNPEHLAHMLDMEEDESVDEETARLWGQNTAVGCLVEMARRFSASLAADNLTLPQNE